MSWLSKALGLDKNPKELAQVNAVGNALLKAGEAVIPGAAAVVNLVTSLANPTEAPAGTPATATATVTVPAGSTLHTIVADGEKLIVALDPNFDTQIIGGVNKFLESKGLKAEEGEVDTFLTNYFATIKAAAASGS